MQITQFSEAKRENIKNCGGVAAAKFICAPWIVIPVDNNSVSGIHKSIFIHSSFLTKSK